MNSAEQSPKPVRIRREPPQFRDVEVRAVESAGPRLIRLTLAGADLEAMAAAGAAASVRLLLPPAGKTEIVRPTWNGNEFLLPDGRRPPIRTFTPLRADPDAGDLALEIVVHGAGVASTWAATAEPGRRAAISGPGRRYTVDLDAPAFLLAGDETAIPAISQLLEAVPRATPVHVCIEVAQPDGRVALPGRPRVSVEWCDLPRGAPPGDAMVAAVRAAELPPDARIWAAGEAAAVQRIRRYLFEERGISRARTSVRGYWKHGRAGETDDA
ncbi:MAG TPA: siderophore-interacting protein [Acidimicrobiia bacterium]|nr:siderophore-interacting protein [Acidimicrobiia bacterium]